MGKLQECEYHQVTLDEWLYWKEDIRDKIRETAGNFVYIGYRLKQIRDSGMYDGAADIFEFAKKEYGLSKSTVSRFIAINEKFSEGGNSLELKAEYRDIGSSKLSEMLTLPDAECSMITERTTVTEIRELKSFLRQQPSEETASGEADTADEEPAAGQTEGTADQEGTAPALFPLEKCLIEYFRDKKGLLNDILPLIYKNRYDRAAELINPSGYSTYRKGLVFLFMYDFEKGVSYKVFGSPDVAGCRWEEFLLQIYDIYSALYEAGEDDIHGAFYGEREEPEKPPAASPGKAQEKQSGDTGKARKGQASVPVATSQQKEKKVSGSMDANLPEEQLPGQMEVIDYPELVPESGYEEIKGGSGSRDAEKPESQEGQDAGSRMEEKIGENAAGGLPGEGWGQEAAQADASGSGSGDGAAGSDIQEPAEGTGTPQGGGCEADPWESVKGQGFREIWDEATTAEKGLERFVLCWHGMDPSAFPAEELEEAYKDAINLAAAMEKLKIVRDANGGINHA